MLPTLFYHYRPAPPLDRFIDQLSYWVGDAPGHEKDRLMPDGGCSLIINLAEDEVRNYSGADDSVIERFPGAVLVGVHSRYSVIDAREQTAIIAVTFRPGGSWPFFEPAADELHNQHISLGDLWGCDGRSLRERLLAEPTPHDALRLLERELLAHALRPLQRRPEVEFALQRLSWPIAATSIERLSKHTGLSTRRLSRLFALEVGLTPKLYARIKRFERTFLAGRSSIVDWSELAHTFGYFDQSHLIRDCRLLSGFTPTELRARWNGFGHHVPLP